jgi:aminoglycoside phosphotransferase family enzyme
MNQNQIDKLISHGEFSSPTKERKLVETHISWVILCDQYVYKIKKPMHYSFLDFSTIELRKHFCERELELNRRFTENVYLEVLPIYETNNRYQIGGEEARLPDGQGKIVDYALKMRKLDTKKQMDALLAKNEVSGSNIEKLAERIADFHKNATIIYKIAVLDIKEMFNDLGKEKEFISQNLNSDNGHLIAYEIEASDSFLVTNEKLLRERLASGFFRDVHGDLHTRNIFLLPDPQPFDCIEFNDGYRQIDILNEVAFLCMDLDALGRHDLSDLFIEHYNRLLPAMRNEAERKLFVYYKSYRANIRAKVNSLRARSATNKVDKAKALAEVKKYIGLMDGYIKSLDI